MASDDRPAVIMRRGDAELIAAVAAELRAGPPADAYDAALLTHLVNRMGIAPRAVISHALVALCDQVTGSHPRRPRRRKPKPPALPAPKGWNDGGLLERKAEE